MLEKTIIQDRISKTYSMTGWRMGYGVIPLWVAEAEDKQMVRGVERWYVDFDKCIPYFAESASCGMCIAVCPWTRPDVRPKLLATMARRLGQAAIEA